MDEVRLAFGLWLTQRRALYFPSQQALRKELELHGLELSKNTISKWENGNSIPKKQHRAALWAVLRVVMWSQRLGMALDGWDLFPGESIQAVESVA